MSLDKPTIPTWAETADPTDMDTPAGVKQNAGWDQAEKPPSEWMNWLQRQFSRLGSFFSKYLGFTLNKTMSGTITWASGAGTITFAADLEISVFIDGAYYVNKILAADSPIAIADGEVLVFAPTDSVATLASIAYGSLVEGKYSIVAAAALTQQTTFQQVVLFYRSGTELAMPLFNQRLTNDGTISIGAMQSHTHADAAHGGQLDWDDVWSDAVHNHDSNAEGGTLTWADALSVAAAGDHAHTGNTVGGTLDHGLALTGLGDDDHTIYSLAAGTRDFTGNVKCTAAAPINVADLTRKDYVDGITVVQNAPVQAFIKIIYNDGAGTYSYSGHNIASCTGAAAGPILTINFSVTFPSTTPMMLFYADAANFWWQSDTFSSTTRTTIAFGGGGSDKTYYIWYVGGMDSDSGSGSFV